MATKGQPSPRKGIPNKATAEARRAIADFVDNNAGRLQGWLDRIAEGEPMLDEKGLHVVSQDGQPRWVMPPNPQKAFELFQSVVEYHVPKLARQEITGPGGGALNVHVHLDE